MIIAGGGTGGHIFPGVAVAKNFLGRSAENKILHVGSKMGMEGKIVPKYGLELELISLGGIKGKNFVKKIANILKLPSAIFDSMKIIKNFKPDIVFGVGGYASYPTLFTAKILGIKTAILEQNTVAGLANRLLGLLVDRIYIAFKYTERFFPKGKVLLTGNPVREEILEIGKIKVQEKDVFVIFVFGGSQGASSINHAVIDSLDELEELKQKIRFIHQTGEKDYEFVRGGYEKKGFRAEVFPFTDDIAQSFKESDLVISRSGSGVCEIVDAGKPSILIPYPFSSFDHQEVNAKLLVEEGAAVKIDNGELDGEVLSRLIRDLFENRKRLEEMANNSLRLAMPQATDRVTDDLVSLGGGSLNV